LAKQRLRKATGEIVAMAQMSFFDALKELLSVFDAVTQHSFAQYRLLS